MDTLTHLFTYYDQLIGKLPPYAQNIVSLALLLILVWQIFMMFKSGHWIFIAIFVIMLPSTWPATRHVGLYILAVFKFLFMRIFY